MTPEQRLIEAAKKFRDVEKRFPADRVMDEWLVRLNDLVVAVDALRAEPDSPAIAVVAMLRPPKGYGIDEKHWDSRLRECVEKFGCDWLDWITKDYEMNLIAISILEAATKRKGGE